MIRLPGETVQLLTSGQIISNVSSLVKELIENSLDAGAEHVEVVMEKFGLHRIQVVDNGNGIPKCEISQVCKRYCTSKLVNFEDLAQVKSYGFRGEALHSICSVGNVEISTRTSDRELGERHEFDHDGNLASSQPISMVVGTRVTVTNLFANIPVRQKVFSSPSKGKEEIKQITRIMQSFKIALPSTRFTFKHDGHSMLQLPKAEDVGSAITLLHGKSVLSCLNPTYINRENFSLTGYIPCVDKQNVSRSNSDLSVLIVNKRPAIVPNFNSFIRKFLIEQLNLPSRVYPIYFLHLEVLSDKIDINVSADKGTILLHDLTNIVDAVREEWEIVYKQREESAGTSVVPVISNRVGPEECSGDVSTEITLDLFGREVLEVNELFEEDPGLSFKLTIDEWSQERIERDGIKETDSTPVKAKNPLSSTLKEPKTAKKRKSSQQKTISFTGDTQNITRAHPDHIITHSLTTIRADVAKTSSLKSPTPGPPPSPILIGSIDDNKFIFSITPSLYIGDKEMLLEQSIYFKLIQTFQLQAKPLPQPLIISDITVDLQCKISRLKREESSNESSLRLVDDCIVNNGFEVVICLNALEEVDKIEITGLASLYKEEGVEHFLLLLGELGNQDTNVTNTIVRTNIVREFLRGEAKRELKSRKPAQFKELEEIIQLECERDKISGSICNRWYHYFNTL